MTLSLDQLRREAKRLRRAHEAKDAIAMQRIAQQLLPSERNLKHADYLHVVARERGFASWPKLKLASETVGLDRAARQQRLKMAMAHGQNHVAEHLLSETPDLAEGLLELQIALYDLSAVEAAIARDHMAAVCPLGPRSPICHLAFSRWIHARPDLESDMLAIAEVLVANGADVNDGIQIAPGGDHTLSALFGAIGHADNIALGRWLLEHDADPNDGKSLYHATELGHHEGLKLLLAHGADPRGINALFRAMDFHDHAAVQMLIDASARVEDFNSEEIGGEAPWTLPALFQAARRGSDERMIALLLGHGADPSVRYKGASACACARVYGNATLARALQARGAATELTEIERHLASAAAGEIVPGALEGRKIPEPYENLMREILHLPGRGTQVERLLALGLDPDAPDREGLTPLHISGWEGLPDMMDLFLSQGADLGHVNGYDGTLISTILHGSENHPAPEIRNHLGCVELALSAGAVPTPAEIRFAGQADLAEALVEWAEAQEA